MVTPGVDSGAAAELDGGASLCEPIQGPKCCTTDGETISAFCAPAEPPTCPDGSSLGGCALRCTLWDRPCGAEEFCDFSTHSCGPGTYNDASSTCRIGGTECDSNSGPVCGCSGTIYESECDAYADGSDIAARFRCETPPGLARCGERFCDPLTHWCDVGVAQVGDPGLGRCRALTPCESEDPCDCLAEQPNLQEPSFEECRSFRCSREDELVVRYCNDI